MSSPIAHAAVGYAIFQCFRSRLPESSLHGTFRRISWAMTTFVFSMLPDVDVIPGLLFNDLAAYHKQASHSLLVCIAASLPLGLILSVLMSVPRKLAIGFVLTCLLGHLAVDFITQGRGLILFWPFSLVRFPFQYAFFAGVPWSEPLTSPHYLLMFTEDTCFAVVVIVLVALAKRRRMSS